MTSPQGEFDRIQQQHQERMGYARPVADLAHENREIALEALEDTVLDLGKGTSTFSRPGIWKSVARRLQTYSAAIGRGLPKQR